MGENLSILLLEEFFWSHLKCCINRKSFFCWCNSKSFLFVAWLFIYKIVIWLMEMKDGNNVFCSSDCLWRKSHTDFRSKLANVDGTQHLLSAKSHFSCHNISVTGISACHRVGRGLLSHLNKKCTSFVK